MIDSSVSVGYSTTLMCCITNESHPGSMNKSTGQKSAQTLYVYSLLHRYKTHGYGISLKIFIYEHPGQVKNRF